MAIFGQGKGCSGCRWFIQMRTLSPEFHSPDSIPYWQHEIRVKQFFTLATDWTSVNQSMNRVADALSASPLFDHFASLEAFRDEGDMEKANLLLDKFYDFCDEMRIWVG
jgi:hypothetical protein